MATGLTTRRFTVEDYYRMAEAGILTADERVELLDGAVAMMEPIGSPHAACVDRLNRLLNAAVGDRAIVRVQNPIRLDRYSEPQTDLALLRPRDDFYARAHPGPGDVLLVIEVAHKSAPVDRTVKLPLYARKGIPTAWLVLLEEDRILVHEQPGPEGYRAVRGRQRGDRLRLEALPGVDLPVADVLGPR
jgi:Uma2 family endonuclease